MHNGHDIPNFDQHSTRCFMTGQGWLVYRLLLLLLLPCYYFRMHVKDIAFKTCLGNWYMLHYQFRILYSIKYYSFISHFFSLALSKHIGIYDQKSDLPCPHNCIDLLYHHRTQSQSMVHKAQFAHIVSSANKFAHKAQIEA